MLAFSEKIPGTSITLEATAVKLDTTRFSGHETFTLRYGWLTKAIRLVREDAQGFSRDDAMVALGVGKNMVQSIKHWALAVRVLEEDSQVKDNRGRSLRVSPFGDAIFGDGGLDPFLENPSTLWLLHFCLASRSTGPTTWYWAFNAFPRAEFTADQLAGELLRVASESDASKATENTIRRDVNCFVRTYVSAQRSRTVAIEDTLDCPLSELRLIYGIDESGLFAFNRSDHLTLPTWVFAFALLDYWERVAANVATLGFSDIAYEPSSPGRVFKLTESAVSRHLHSLEKVSKGALSFDSTAGISQVYRHRRVGPMDLLPGRRLLKLR